ncbi:MAG: FtsQ-type POTRA domain-containing protein [Caldilineales bacterium]|nr:FtsQ-type POTRA domain-containing protein [Caldilineales bacterium]MDW8316304.1 FtsQ-type POTRA domain-containing protein [Anaerolineae bacterium]
MRSTVAAPKARVARRRVAPRLPRLNRRRLAVLAAFGGLAALLVWFFVDDRFYVQTVEVEGLRFTDRAAVLQQADLYGYSIFWVNGREVARRVEALPTVKHATVRALLPNRVRIRVTEREPVVLWVHNGEARWLDQEGLMLPVADATMSLPTLFDQDGSTVLGDDRVHPEVVNSVAELHRHLPEVGQFAYSRERGLHFTLRSGALVVLGDSQQLAERVRHLIALQSTLAAQRLTAREIDLSQPGGYTMKLAP